MFDIIQPSLGELFTGIGIMILLFVFAYFFWQIGKLYRGIVENQLHYSVLEDVLLQRVAKKKGIDLQKEMIKRDFLREHQKNFKRKIQTEMYEEFFGKEKEEK